MYVLLGIAIILAIVFLYSFIPTQIDKHPPIRPHTHCRCGAKADIIDHERPWRVWCAHCHVRYLERKGEIL